MKISFNFYFYPINIRIKENFLSYNNFDICIWSKTDRKKGLKNDFFGFLGAPKGKILHPPHKHLVTATKPEHFFLFQVL